MRLVPLRLILMGEVYKAIALLLLSYLIFAADDDEPPGLVLALPLEGHVDNFLRHGVGL